MKKFALLTLIGAVVLAALAAGVGASAGSAAAAEIAMPHRAGMASAPDAPARQPMPTATPAQGAGRSESRKVEAMSSAAFSQQEMSAAALHNMPSPTPTARVAVQLSEAQFQASEKARARQESSGASFESSPLGPLQVLVSNDDFDQAFEIMGLPFTYVGSTVGATTAADDPELCVGSGTARGATVWFRLVAPVSTPLLLNTFGSNYDTMLAVFTGERGNLTMLACNDDFGSLQSQVQMNLVAGTVYFIEVAHYDSSGAGGDLVLSGEAIPFTSCASVVGMSQTECEALVDLYNNTNGSAWLNRTNWLVTNRPCEWYGVSCNYGVVTGLFLNGNQLNGTLPSQLGNLGGLQFLWLHNNALVGTIPATLGNLSNLRMLYLYENQLSGPIPLTLGGFGSLGNLEELSIYNNQLSGTIPVELATLTSLQQLRLDGNQLTGGIPAEFGAMPNLIGLELQSNQLSGAVPTELGNLANLQWLRLDNNQLSGGIPPQLGNLSRLRDLSLGGNPLGGQIPMEFGNLSQLRTLALYSNQLNGNIPASLGNLLNLWYLDLDANQLSGNIPEQFGSLLQMQELYLYSNQLSGSIPTSLGSLANLRVLELGGNLLSGSIPVELGNLVELQVLYLPFNELTGPIPSELGALTNLHTLGLHNNQLSSSIPWSLGSLANLQWLSLNNNQLSGLIPSSLGSLGNLIRLYLRSNQLNGSIPAELGNLNNLALLDLSSNQLSGSIPAELGSLTSLERLYLYANQLTGSIPPSLGNLVQLQSLALYQNQLSGSIPGELGNLVNLGYFDLEANLLVGPIPPQLGNLINLQSLWLANNQLNSAIPPELGSLSNLTYLYLHNNQLSGSLPVELSNLVNLRDLYLDRNPLRGELPDRLTNLTAMETFYFYGTQLCVPDNPALQNWLAAIPVVSGTGYYCSELAPAAVLTKLVNGVDVGGAAGPYLNVGAPVTWTYVLTNTGGVALVEMSLVDEVEGAVTECAPYALQGSLPPGESTVCTLVGSVIAGHYTNTATFIGMPEIIFSEPVSAYAVSYYVGAVPGVTMVKLTNGVDVGQTPGPSLRVGEPVQWTYYVTNTGNTPLLGMTLIDDREGEITDCIPSLATPLAPGAGLVCTKSGAVQAGQYVNGAEVSGSAPTVDPIVVTSTDLSYYHGIRAELSVDKTTQGQNPTAPPGSVLLSGVPVSWAYTVRNLGDVPILDVVLSDDREGMITECAPVQLPATLQPGAATVCAKTGIAQVGQYANTATVSGIAVSPDSQSWQLSATDTSYYLGRGGEVQFTKQINGQSADRPPGLYLGIGESVTWSYRITNTGHVALTNMSIVDDREGTISNCTPSLASGLTPGASIVCTKSGVSLRGQYSSTALFVSQSASAPVHQVQATATSYYFGSNSEMNKSVFPTHASIGDELTFTLVITTRIPDRQVTFHVVEQLPPQLKLLEGSVLTDLGSASFDSVNNVIRWSHAGPAGVSTRVTVIYRARLMTSCFTEAISITELFEDGDSAPAGRADAVIQPAGGEYCVIFLPMLEKARPSKSVLPSLVNYNFEQGGGVGWTQRIDGSSNTLIFTQQEKPRVMIDGDWYAWLGGVNNQTNELSQQITLPSDYSDLRLRYLHWIQSDEDSCTNDRAEVRLNGTVIKSYQLCKATRTFDPAKNYGWRWEILDLAAFKGQTVTLAFWSQLNASRLSNFFVDIAQLCSSDADAPAGTVRCSDPPTP